MPTQLKENYCVKYQMIKYLAATQGIVLNNRSGNKNHWEILWNAFDESKKHKIKLDYIKSVDK